MLQLLPVPAFDDNYVWLAADEAGNAVVVDPGDAAPVEAALERTGWQLRAILATHHHPDHIGGVEVLRARHGVPVYAPHEARIAHADVRCAQDQSVLIAAPALHVDVLEVPGHTSSHIAFHGAGLLFCGDVLFSVGCGRVFEGTPAQMLASLEKLAALPGDTRVCCGHEYTLANCAFALTVEPDNTALRNRAAQARIQREHGQPTLPTTIEQERATNPFLRVDAAAVIAWAQREHAVAPEDRVARFAALREAKNGFKAPAA